MESPNNPNFALAVKTLFTELLPFLPVLSFQPSLSLSLLVILPNKLLNYKAIGLSFKLGARFKRKTCLVGTNHEQLWRFPLNSKMCRLVKTVNSSMKTVFAYWHVCHVDNTSDSLYIYCLRWYFTEYLLILKCILKVWTELTSDLSNKIATWRHESLSTEGERELSLGNSLERRWHFGTLSVHYTQDCSSRQN